MMHELSCITRPAGRIRRYFNKSRVESDGFRMCRKSRGSSRVWSGGVGNFKGRVGSGGVRFFFKFHGVGPGRPDAIQSGWYAEEESDP